MSPQLYFLHILKTAGTSVHDFLCNMHALGEVFDDGYYPEDFRDWSKIHCKIYHAYVGGHFGRDILSRLNNDHRIITWLREPVDRFLSECEMYINDLADKTRGLHQFSHLAGGNLEMIVQAPQTDASLHYLGSTYRRTLGSRHQKSPLPQGKTTSVCNANKFLDEIGYVGIVEKGLEAWDLMAITIGWIPPSFAPRKNVGKRKLSLDTLEPALANRIRQALEPEGEIYRHGLLRFREQASAAFHRFGLEKPERYTAEVRRLFLAKALPEIEDAVISRVYGPANNGCEVDFSGPLLGSGWNHRELPPGKSGKVYRWTISRGLGSSIMLPFPTSGTFWLRIRILAPCYLNEVHKPMLIVNGLPLPQPQIELDPTGPEGSSIVLLRLKVTQIPPHPWLPLKRLFELHIKAPGMSQLSLVPAEETRDLAACIDWIGLEV